jgi:hypothetical protein
VSAPGYARTRLSPVRAGAEDVVIRLATELRIRVTVVDAADGAPVPAATALAQEVLGPLRRETSAVASGFDGEGVVVIGGLKRGRYEVIAVAHGYAPSEPVAVTLDGGDASVRIDLDRGGRVTGRVVSAEGSRPLAGARVSLEDRIGAGSAAVPLSASVLSSEDGRFELGGVPAGLRSIVVYAADHHGRILSGVVVRSGETTDLGALDLTPTDEGERPRLELAGVGAVLSSQEDVLVIQRVIEGGGAAEVGLVPGDAILEVAGSPVTTLGFGGAIEAIRGPEGTNVQLLIRRADGAVVLLAVPRRRIRA